MKKILVITSIALLSFAACNNQAATTSTEIQTVSANDTETLAPASSQIAYIQLDTLLSRYDMFKDMSAELEEKAKKAEAEINSKGRSLERGIADYTEKVEKGLVTRAQAAELEEKLQKQNQSFLEFSNKQEMAIAEESQVMQNNVFHNIQKFLEELNSDFRYGMIVTTSAGTPVIHADPRLDITDIVVKGLNEQYAKEKK